MAQVVATDQGWLMRIPDDIAAIMEVPIGSVGVLHPSLKELKVEILPPLSAEIHASVLQGCEELREVMLELKRIGD